MDRRSRKLGPSNSDIYLDAIKFYGRRNFTAEELRIFALKKYHIDMTSRLKKPCPGETNSQDFESVKSRSVKKLEDILEENKQNDPRKAFSVAVQTVGKRSSLPSSASSATTSNESVINETSASSDETFDERMMSDIHWPDYSNENGMEQVQPKKRRRGFSVQIEYAGNSESSISSFSDQCSEGTSISSAETLGETRSAGSESLQALDAPKVEKNEALRKISLHIECEVDGSYQSGDSDTRSSNSSVAKFDMPTEELKDNISEIVSTVENNSQQADLDVEEAMEVDECSEFPEKTNKSVRFNTPQQDYEVKDMTISSSNDEIEDLKRPSEISVQFHLSDHGQNGEPSQRFSARQIQRADSLAEDMYVVTQLCHDSPKLPDCTIATSLQWISELGGWVRTSAQIGNPWLHRSSEESQCDSLDLETQIVNPWDKHIEGSRISTENVVEDIKQEYQLDDQGEHCQSPGSEFIEKDPIANIDKELNSLGENPCYSEANEQTITQETHELTEHESQQGFNFEIIIDTALCTAGTGLSSRSDNELGQSEQIISDDISVSETEYLESDQQTEDKVENAVMVIPSSSEVEVVMPSDSGENSEVNAAETMSETHQKQQSCSDLDDGKLLVMDGMDLDSATQLSTGNASTDISTGSIGETPPSTDEQSSSHVTDAQHQDSDQVLEMEIEGVPDMQENGIPTNLVEINNFVANDNEDSTVENSPIDSVEDGPNLSKCPVESNDEDAQEDACEDDLMMEQEEQSIEYGQEMGSWMESESSETEKPAAFPIEKPCRYPTNKSKIISDLVRAQKIKITRQILEENMRKRQHRKNDSICNVQ